MARTKKVLGQAAPNATTETTVYSVPASTTAIISTVTVCNRSTATTFRLSVSVGGGATANKDYLAYDAPIDANDTVTLTLGITVGAADILRAYAGSANLSIGAFGIEETT